MKLIVFYLIFGPLLVLAKGSLSHTIDPMDGLESHSIFALTPSPRSVLPSAETPLKLTYKFRDLNLQPNDVIYLNLPEKFKSRPVDFVFITHKQDPRDEKECVSAFYNGVPWDCSPGYTSFEIKDANADQKNEEWRHWGGPGSGPFNSKFAEIRSHQGETDNLYEWAKYGHISVASKNRSHDPLIPSQFRVRSVGPDSIILQEVVVKFLPDEPKKMTEVIFAQGLAFGNFIDAKGRKYPGRAAYGDYGTALRLGPHNTPPHSLIPQHWDAFKGGLSIPLDESESFRFIDIACGDMRPNNGSNPDAYRGNGKLSVWLVRARDGSKTQLMNFENVGTNGVMRATLDPREPKTRPEDRLLIESPSDVVQIMGIRLGFGN